MSEDLRQQKKVLENRATELRTQKDTLGREVLKLEASIQGVEAKLAQQRGEFLMSQIDNLLALVPDHDSTNCSDSKIHRHDCLRCTLLTAKHERWWDTDYDVQIQLIDRSDLDGHRRSQV
jgi:hypothetical protein